MLTGRCAALCLLALETRKCLERLAAEQRVPRKSVPLAEHFTLLGVLALHRKALASPAIGAEHHLLHVVVVKGGLDAGEPGVDGPLDMRVLLDVAPPCRYTSKMLRASRLGIVGLIGILGCHGGEGGSTTEASGTTGSAATSTGPSAPTTTGDDGTTTGGQATTEMSSETGATGPATGAATTGPGTTSGPGTTTGEPDVPPPKPDDLTHWVTGDPADADVQPSGPGLILMGGGTDVDAAFEWQKQYVAGGDVVVLRASGADGYNDYLYSQIGGIDSVETLLVDTPALAQEPYVAWTIAHAEAVFIAGGDQAVYMTAWKDTPVEDALMQVYARGGVVGGTSAGLAVLGEFVYAAYNDSVIEDEALLDPYNMYMTMDRDFLALPPLAAVVTDSHFTARRRLCRLIGFVARIVEDSWSDVALGIGVDEQTALVVGPDNVGEVLGAANVHLLHSNGPPQLCAPDQPLAYADLDWYVLGPGDTVPLPAGVPAVPTMKLSADGGMLTPAYDCQE